MSSESSAKEAWGQYCERLKAAGEACLDARPDIPPADRLEGLKYLAWLAADGIRVQLGPPIPGAPYMYRFVDELSQYAMPNADVAYFYSPLDGRQAYKLTGNTRGRDFIISLGTGEYPLWDYGEVAEVHGSQLVVDEEGGFELILSADEVEGNRMHLDPAVTMVMIRDYYQDWDDDPGWFYLEHLDGDSRAPAAVELMADVPRRLGRAGEYFDATAQFWADYADRWRGGEPNTFAEPKRVQMGSLGLQGYSVGWLRLEPGQAMVIELDPPEGIYWMVQIYSRWGFPLDPAVAQSTLNNRQVVADEDGLVRLVVCAEDPGFVNWLDSRGYTDAAIWLRGMPWNNMPQPKVAVMPAEDVRSALPLAKTITEAERRSVLAWRQRCIARRFRR